MIILIAPVAETQLEFFEPQKLLGYTIDTIKSEITIQNWFSGKLQTYIENKFNENLGFRGHMIKAENQLNFELFREISSGTRAKIILGKNNYLYEKAYIDAFNAVDSIHIEEIEKKVLDLKKLQKKSEQFGAAFVVLIAPSKASVYPEYIPEKHVLEKNEDTKTNYEHLAQLLGKHHINHFDSHAFLVEKKETQEYELFARGGTHWNYYAACLVAEDFTIMLERISNKNLVNVSCDSTAVDNTSVGTDRDLTDLTNLWNDSSIDGRIAHPLFNVKAQEEEYRPDILFVGDSFMHTILAIMEHGPMYKSRELYYYYNTVHSRPENTESTIDRTAINWEKDVFSKDIIVIEVSETGIPELGFGFVEDAIK